MKDLSNLRKEYTQAQLTVNSLEKSPILQFQKWFDQALKAAILEPNAMVLSTVDFDNIPSQRTVLLKYFNDLGFVFFSNYTSSKAQHLDVNPNASLLFPWYTLERQVILMGKVERIPVEESKAYFFSRPHGSQLGAWVSKQSSVIDSRQVLEDRLSEIKRQFSEGNVPFPSFWGGYRLIPKSIEFWQGGMNRLHDRIVYKQVESTWTMVRLSP
ncbi:MAG: pyridoxamine 5'-phosphate oxidase [Flammeovirgaceae bacterium]|nr:pyridoxamine 5'-phosphate oxidase [Flammeovirgaceae bacterium]|tara:strand:- start:2456 stop:3094 length:639 start_codon:yes stop_codon:yes gene_type:complete